MIENLKLIKLYNNNIYTKYTFIIELKNIVYNIVM